MPYPSDIQAQMQQIMSEQRAKLETAYYADPKIKSAKDALEQAKEHLANEKTIQSNLDRGPDWHRWSFAQQQDVRSQMGNRVMDAEEAVRAAERAVDAAIGNHIAEGQQAAQDAAKAEQHAAQVEQAAAEKANFRAEAKQRWLAAGGSENAFNERFEGMWIDEVEQRVQQTPNEQEAMRQKLLSSGRYTA